MFVGIGFACWAVWSGAAADGTASSSDTGNGMWKSPQLRRRQIPVSEETDPGPLPSPLVSGGREDPTAADSVVGPGHDVDVPGQILGTGCFVER